MCLCSLHFMQVFGILLLLDGCLLEWRIADASLVECKYDSTSHFILNIKISYTTLLNFYKYLYLSMYLDI
jgi:hypothetical protein